MGYSIYLANFHLISQNDYRAHVIMLCVNSRYKVHLESRHSWDILSIRGCGFEVRHSTLVVVETDVALGYYNSL